jgi:hypothetical protein
LLLLLLLLLLLQVPGAATWLCGLFAHNYIAYSALPSLILTLAKSPLLLLLLLQVVGAAPWLAGLFAYNYSALPSLGLSGSALSGMKAAIPKLISGV